MDLFLLLFQKECLLFLHKFHLFLMQQIGLLSSLFQLQRYCHLRLLHNSGLLLVRLVRHRQLIDLLSDLVLLQLPYLSFHRWIRSKHYPYHLYMLVNQWCIYPVFCYIYLLHLKLHLMLEYLLLYLPWHCNEESCWPFLRLRNRH